jgi:hypothetical protein
MGRPWEISQPSYHRTGINAGSTAIVVGTILKRGTGEQEVDIATAASDAFAGIAIEDMPVGIGRSVQVDGVAVVRTGAAVAIGDKLTSDSTGRAVPVSSTSQNIIGVAVTAATAADQTVSVELTKSGAGTNSNVFKRELTLVFGDLTDADTSQSFSIGAPLPAGARMLGYRVNRTAAFVKGAQTFIGQIGIAGTLNKYADNLDIDGTPAEDAAALGPKNGATEQLLFTVTTNTGTLASSTAGALTAEVLFSVPA